MNINNITVPDILENITFEDIKAEIVNDLKSRLPDYEPLESDPYMPVIEAVAYRELLLRSRINSAIRAVLLPTSTGVNLDNVTAMYAVERLKGVKPRAEIELKLTVKREYDAIIPAGTVFTDNDRTYFSRLITDVVIAAGSISKVGIIELEEFVIDSQIKTETIVTPLPFVAIPVQITNFSGGHMHESDEAFRVRAVQSLDRYSTAGSVGSYRYHALSATPAVKDVYVHSTMPGIANVVIQVLGTETDRMNTKDAVVKALSPDTVRPVTEFVEVVCAECRKVDVKAQIELFDIKEAASIIAKIENNFNKSWGLGEDLNLSYIYKIMHVEGVYKVTLYEPLTDIAVSKGEYIEVDLTIGTRGTQI